MERDGKVLHRKRNIILATACMLLLNLALSMELTSAAPDGMGTQATSWNEIFIYVRPFSVLLYVAYLLSLFERTADIGRRIASFISAHMDTIFLFAVFLYLTLYEMYGAYFAAQYISQDSRWYMREASSLLAGNGFYVDRLAGYDTWFASWPIGYPALIAAATAISGKSVYLSSKLLSIALVGLGLAVLRMRFRKDAWVFSLIYLNTGFLAIYRYTWSENPFILSLMVWGIALAAIVEEPVPGKRWYVIAALGISGAFLTRYFGIVTLLFTGFCLLLYILYYFAKNRDSFILRKIKGLICVEIASSIVVGSYFLMNQTMGGSISGVDRQAWWDDYGALIDNLYDALIAEIHNATRLDVTSLIPYADTQGKAAVILLLLAVLSIVFIRNYQKEKKLDYKTVFIGAGVFYYLVFIVVRFHSSMDDFSYRFFAPAGMMVSMGVLGLIKDKFNGRLKRIQMVMCLFLFILCAGIAQKLGGYTADTSAFHVFYNQVTDTVASIPPKGIVLNYDGAYQLAAFRPDIMINGHITYEDTMEEIALRYAESDSIWIRRGVLNMIVNCGDYSDEIRDTFLQYVDEGASEDEYVQVY